MKKITMKSTGPTTRRYEEVRKALEEFRYQDTLRALDGKEYSDISIPELLERIQLYAWIQEEEKLQKTIEEKKAQRARREDQRNAESS